MRLWDIAHARAGDKGNNLNISLIAYNIRDYVLLRDHITAELVKKTFGDFVKGKVVRYELPQLGAMNFVLYDALNGGVNRSLSLDAHGKTLSSRMLEIELNI